MTEGFAAIPNWMYRDSTASLHALVVYGALASHSGPGGIYPSRETLAKEARCSVRQVARALNELEELGVMKRVRRTGKKGQQTSGYELRPHGPLSADESLEEVGDSQSSTMEVGDSQSLGGGLSVQIAPLIEEEPLKKNPSIVSPSFDAFWEVYPRRAGKQAAKAKWEQLAKKGVDLQAVLAGARRFAADPNLPETQFIPHPITWLNQGRWEDDPLPARESAAKRSTVEHGRSVDEILAARESGTHLRAVGS